MIPGAPALLVKQLARLSLTPAAFKAAGVALKTVLDEHTEIRKAGLKGRTRSTPRGSKAKGREGVLAVREWLVATFAGFLTEGDIQVQTTSVGGSDLWLSPAACLQFPWAPEIKNVQSLNVWKALKQAEVNARKRGRLPILFIKRNNSSLYVVISATEFARVLSPDE